MDNYFLTYMIGFDGYFLTCIIGFDGVVVCGTSNALTEVDAKKEFSRFLVRLGLEEVTVDEIQAIRIRFV